MFTCLVASPLLIDTPLGNPSVPERQREHARRERLFRVVILATAMFVTGAGKIRRGRRSPRLNAFLV